MHEERFQIYIITIVHNVKTLKKNEIHKKKKNMCHDCDGRKVNKTQRDHRHVHRHLSSKDRYQARTTIGIISFQYSDSDTRKSPLSKSPISDENDDKASLLKSEPLSGSYGSMDYPL